MKIKKVYLGRKQIYPDGWKPGEDTLFYASLNGNYNATGKLNPTYNSSSGIITYPTTGGIQYAYLNSGKLIWDISTPPTNITTFQARVKGINEGSIATGKISGTWNDNVGEQLYFSGSKWFIYTQNGSNWYKTGDNSSTNTWYLVTGVKNGTTLSFYKNGTLIGSTTCASVYNQHNYLYVANNNRGLTEFKIGVSNIILEDKARTDQEITDYFNQTKSLYGIS